MCPIRWPGPVVASSWGAALVLPAGWPLLGCWRRGLGGGGPPLRGSPGPPLGMVPALFCCGGSRHSLWCLLLGRFLVPRVLNQAGGGQAGTPLKGSTGAARDLVRAGSSSVVGGLWTRTSSPLSGARRPGGSCGAACLSHGSTGALQAQQAVGHPAAPLHRDADELVHKGGCVVRHGKLQQLDQAIFIQPQEAQGGGEEVFHHLRLRVISPMDAPQLLAQPGQHGTDQSWVVSQKGGPDFRLEASHKSRPCS